MNAPPCRTHRLDRLTLEAGPTLRDVPVAYRSWGTLNAAADNAVVVCHPLTANSDAADWWSGLIGPGRPVDPARHFVVCLNVLGSPYGSLSPLTVAPETGAPYGGSFPAVSVRDTVAAHAAVLRALGVRRVAAAVGGSMGGMHALEWAFVLDEAGAPLVRAVVAVAVGARHSAWGVAWTEAQRQAIYADARWQDGRYAEDAPPVAGLAAARAIANLSYRTRDSYETRFTDSADTARTDAVAAHVARQGERFVARFDARCYVSLTKQLNTHDVARGRGALPDVLARVRQPTLVVGISSDVLYPLEEQQDLARRLPHGRFATLHSSNGHDAFLLDADRLAPLVAPFLAAHADRPSRAARPVRAARPAAPSIPALA